MSTAAGAGSGRRRRMGSHAYRRDDQGRHRRVGGLSCRRPIPATSAGRSSWPTRSAWRTTPPLRSRPFGCAAPGQRAAAGHRRLRALRTAHEPALHGLQATIPSIAAVPIATTGRPALPGSARTVCRRVRGNILLEALRPDRIALAIAALGQIEEEARQLERQWALRRERARYESERAWRQYDAVEPENRLVARSLERIWEEKLRAAEAIEQDYERWRHDEPFVLNEPDRVALQKAGRRFTWHLARPNDNGGGAQAHPALHHRAEVVLDQKRFRGQVWFKDPWRWERQAQYLQRAP